MTNETSHVQQAKSELIGIVSTDPDFDARIRSALRNGVYSFVSANDFEVLSLNTNRELIVVDARTAAACNIASEARDSDAWAFCPMIGVLAAKNPEREFASQSGSQVFDVEIKMDFTDGEIIEWVRRINWRA